MVSLGFFVLVTGPMLTSRGRDLCRTLTREVRRHETELASPGFDRERLGELLSQLISEAR